MSTCNRLDLQTLGSQPIVPKNLPNQWTPTQMVLEPSIRQTKPDETKRKQNSSWKEASGVEPLTYRTAADCSTTELYLPTCQHSSGPWPLDSVSPVSPRNPT
jgi:hypothetical protein